MNCSSSQEGGQKMKPSVSRVWNQSDIPKDPPDEKECLPGIQSDDKDQEGIQVHRIAFFAANLLQLLLQIGTKVVQILRPASVGGLAADNKGGDMSSRPISHPRQDLTMNSFPRKPTERQIVCLMFHLSCEGWEVVMCVRSGRAHTHASIRSCRHNLQRHYCTHPLSNCSLLRPSQTEQWRKAFVMKSMFHGTSQSTFKLFLDSHDIEISPW